MTILLRLAAFSILWALAFFAFSWSGGEDALGMGLLMFLLVVVASGVWGLVDGLRRGIGELITWVAVGLGFAVVVSVIGVLDESGADWSAIADDLADTGPFIAGLVIVPAAIGALLGAWLRGRRGTATPEVSHI